MFIPSTGLFPVGYYLLDSKPGCSDVFQWTKCHWYTIPSRPVFTTEIALHIILPQTLATCTPLEENMHARNTIAIMF